MIEDLISETEKTFQTLLYTYSIRITIKIKIAIHVGEATGYIYSKFHTDPALYGDMVGHNVTGFPQTQKYSVRNRNTSKRASQSPLFHLILINF
jgi:hypothetical protein